MAKKRAPKKPKLPNRRKPRQVQGVAYKVTHALDRTLTDMRRFHLSQDWRQRWEEFYLSTDETGRFKFKDIKSYAKATAESHEQYLFLVWYLGKNDHDDPDVVAGAAKYKFIKDGQPLDWAEKRATGGWFSEAGLKRVSQEITRRMGALDALRECGNKITLHFMVRAGEMAQQIDKAFRGAIFLPDWDFDSNLKRAKAYMDLQGRVLGYAEKAQRLYAEAHGVNFDDLAGMTALMQAVAVQESQRSGKVVETKERKVFAAITDMILTKSAEYKLPLGEEAEGKILEAISVPEPEGSKGGGKVQ